jgi:hypothetical protein
LATWLAIAVAGACGRPILQPRYLILIQPLLLVLYAAGCCSLPSTMARTGAAVGLLLVMAPSVTRQADDRVQGRNPALAIAAQSLAEHCKQGDVAVLQSPADLNVFCYYANRHRPFAGAARCYVDGLPGKGQPCHTASLAPEEAVTPNQIASTLAHTSRAWFIDAPNPLRADFVLSSRFEFSAADGRKCTVSLLSRAPPEPMRAREPRVTMGEI